MSDQAEGMIQFSYEIGILKHLVRRGWHLIGIPDAERITGHMYRMATLAMALDPIENCDMSKVMRMCLIHDLPECKIGDITPHCGVERDVKHKMEADAMDKITSVLSADKAKRLRDLYHEYEARETVESRLTKELDILDLIIQAFEYEQKIYHDTGELPSVAEFYRNSPPALDFPEIGQMYLSIMKKREEFLRSIDSPQSRKAMLSYSNGPQDNTFSDTNPFSSNGYQNLYPEGHEHFLHSHSSNE